MNWLNKFFGIENTVSAPIVISLVVFIIGGLVNYIRKSLQEYFNRKRIRKTFRLLIKEVVAELKIKEKLTKSFYSKISINLNSNWEFNYATISYLETFFELNFNETYYSFRKVFFWNFCNKSGNRAFHLIWAILRKLKFFEERLQIDINDFEAKYNKCIEGYNSKLEEYRMYHDRLTEVIKNKDVKEMDTEVYSYLKKQDEHWVSWQNLDENNRTTPYMTYNYIIKPILQLNRESTLPIARESDDFLLGCTNQYIELENVFDTYKKVFKNYCWYYRKSYRVLIACLKLI